MFKEGRLGLGGVVDDIFDMMLSLPCHDMERTAAESGLCIRIYTQGQFSVDTELYMDYARDPFSSIALVFIVSHSF